MNIINPATLSRQLAPCVATIGFFDGVHRGHQYLIRRLVAEAHSQQLEATIITFDRHPRQVLQADYQPKLLNTLNEKCALLAETGIDNLVVLPFNEQLARLSAREFMQTVLVNKLNVRQLIMGYDNRFGHNRNESFEDYVAYGDKIGISVIRSDAYSVGAGQISVSSSVVRSLLEAGEVSMAARCLSYPYSISGKVVHGKNIGTDMGFPTANISISDNFKLIPSSGVYAVEVLLQGDTAVRRGMMNIGCRPTFDGSTVSLEVHIFDYDGDLYDKQISVRFIARLRDEKKFHNAGELINQLKRDAEKAKNIFI